jgi:acetyl-CoA carboxylase biotin carboxylase subunit
MIPPYYDSMISKLIVVAQTRDEAIKKMERALDEYIIEGIKSTIPFHQQLLQDENFRKGNFTTKFMETFVIKEK